MFTGIVETRGTLERKIEIGGDCRLVIHTGELSLASCRTGDSICVSGACLTMLDPEPDRFAADVSQETLTVTTLGQVDEGGRVNLELAMGLEDRIGGHMVTGHVDGKARLLSRYEDARAERFEFEAPHDLARYVARKGSVCLDGVSLTVNEVDGDRFSVCLIPHTMEITTLGQLQPGDEVNLEVDLIARYLERLTAPEFQDDDPTDSE
jgi:riboflavin synthase